MDVENKNNNLKIIIKNFNFSSVPLNLWNFFFCKMKIKSSMHFNSILFRWFMFKIMKMIEIVRDFFDWNFIQNIHRSCQTTEQHRIIIHLMYSRNFRSSHLWHFGIILSFKSAVASSTLNRFSSFWFSTNTPRSYAIKYAQSLYTLSTHRIYFDSFLFFWFNANYLTTVRRAHLTRERTLYFVFLLKSHLWITQLTPWWSQHQKHWDFWEKK